MERYQDKTLTPKERARDLLSRMTLREKVGQLNQRLYGFWVCMPDEKGNLTLSQEFMEEVTRWQGLGVLYGLYRADPWSGRTYENGLTGENAIKAYNMVQEQVIRHSRFGIPMLLSSESPHGHQALDGYLLPVNLAVGASFHTELAQKAATVCGGQLREMGIDFALVSMLDVLRDPRWGRCEECFGEDPYLTGKMADAVTKGYLEAGVDVVAKHFAAQGETTGGINASAARIGERELREIHLPPAKAAVDAGVKGIMAAYNEIDGVPCHNNSWLLKEILRDEMGFDGIVMADGLAIDRLQALYENKVSCGAAALASGVDVSLWDEGFTQLEEAVKKGIVSEKRLDEAVERVLSVKFERGLFEKPYLNEKTGKRMSSVSAVDEYSIMEDMSDTERVFPGSLPADDANLQLVRESVVLLKNNGDILPLIKNGRKSKKKIALIGQNSVDIYSQLGDYTPPVRMEEVWTVRRGFQELVEKYDTYELFWCSGEDITEAARLAGECDVSVLVLGGSSSRFGQVVFDANGAAVKGQNTSMDCGEGVDIASLHLSDGQESLAGAVFAAAKQTITIILAGRPYVITEIAEKTDALLYSFYPGPQGGKALAELIFGEQQPSGRMPVSLPRSAGQLPVWYNHRISYEAMSYRDCAEGSLYGFGYGLNYQEILYHDFSISSDTFAENEILTVQFNVCNKGTAPIFAVPMLFVKHRGGSVIPRAAELKGFLKRQLLPGECASLELTLTKEELSVWNSHMQKTTEAGKCVICICDGAKKLWEKEIAILES